MSVCKNCITWGKPGAAKDGYCIQCKDCGKSYFPNQGVNLPLSSALLFAPSSFSPPLVKLLEHEPIEEGFFDKYFAHMRRWKPSKQEVDDADQQRDH